MQPQFVVITGAGSGIGWAAAQALSQQGLEVIAGVRDQAQRDALTARGAARVTPLVLDVTDAAQIEAAAAQIGDTTEAGQLVGLVNCAGIATAGPLEYLPDPDLRRQFDVNVFGLMAVTRALLPRLRIDRGRVVNIGSVGGRLSVPFNGAYCASKFAVRALSDALRVELRPSGIHVALIEPGAIDTPIWETSLAAARSMLDRLGDDIRRDYGPQIEQVEAATRKAAGRAIGADQVAAVVVDAVLGSKPRAQYLVGADAHAQAWLSRLPAKLRDLAVVRALGLHAQRR